MEGGKGINNVWVVAGCVVVVVVVGGVGALMMLQRWKEKKEKYDAKLQLHRNRMRKVYGCMSCGIELLPDDYRYVCGSCREEWSYCVKCYKKGQMGDKSAQHRHRMYHERIRWEVDPSSIGKASTTAKAFEACFEVYAQRPCLGWRRESNGDILDEYKWISYNEVHSRCLAFSRGNLRTLLQFVFELIYSSFTLNIIN